MRKVGRSLLLAVLLAGCLSLSACSFSYTNGSKQIMDQMNIVATLANNGDMTVSETWKVRLLDRGRDYSNLYRSFSLDTAKADEIANVRVTDNDRNLTYTFAGDIDPENAEDTAGLTDESYLHQSDGKAEIGWFMPPIKEGTRTFTITYTLKNIVSVHTDTAVLYNFFLPENFSMPVTNLTGTIRFPSGGSQSAVRAWLHTTAVSNLTIASANTIRFSASSLPPSTSVEVRLCMPPKLFASSTKISGDSVLPGIEKEEQNWAKEYADEQRRQYLLGIADAAGAALILIASIITLILVRRKYRRHKVDAPEYVREIPQGNSPGGVAHLFYFYSGIGDKEKNRIYSATLLSLARKGFLSFSSEDKKNISIRILGNTRQMQLTESEGIFFEMISTVGESENNSFTMKQFKKYAKEHYTYIDSTIENFLIAAKRELTTRGFYESRPLFLGVVKSVGILMFLAAFAIFVATARLNSLFVYLPLSLIFGGILLVIAGSAKMRLSVDGEREYELWHGLKRYMLDFSRMKEYGVPELTLWEEYLVYATMMGISEEVCKQLKLVYPQLNDTEGLDRTLANSYLYYMFWPRYSFGVFGGSMTGNFNFGAELGKSMGEIGTAATRLAHPPAGGNGGFGNGGFGGFGGGGLGGGGFGGGGGGFGGGGGGGVR